MAEFGEKQERTRRSFNFGSALLTTLIVLLLAALTWAALFVAPQYPQWPLHLRFNAADAPAWFAAIVASFSIVAFYLLLRQSGSADMQAIQAGLGRGPSSRGEITTQRIDLEFDAKTFKKRYGQLARIGDEVMLVCEEVPEKGEKIYSTDEIRDQILFLKEEIALRDRVQWVVFVTNENNFVAFQDFDTFLASVLNEQTNRYRKVLNMKDATAFRDAFAALSHKQAETTYRPGNTDVEENVIIFGLNFFSVERNQTRKQMIQYMKEKKIGEVMVVSKQKPVGVVRLSDLVNSTFGSMLG